MTVKETIRPSFFMFDEAAAPLSTQTSILLDEIVQKILQMRW